MLYVVLAQDVADLVCNREPDRPDIDDSGRDDDPCAIADLERIGESMRLFGAANAAWAWQEPNRRDEGCASSVSEATIFEP
ncbi:MAG: hypothetical protein M3680_13730, partial [Myxococcota bacterium]|nr:hypothetical protein [Myxococcota bacterium]